jgi:hypothetical protein
VQLKTVLFAFMPFAKLEKACGRAELHLTKKALDLLLLNRVSSGRE